ncbi:hypothetical protein YQE_12531, partial [Dendroctonus ponderosae]
MDEDDPKEYRWETGYEKTWEAIKEDDDGFLEASVAVIILRAKRRRQAQKKGNTKLGMMRHLFLILDCSESMSSQDLKPTRMLCSLRKFKQEGIRCSIIGLAAEVHICRTLANETKGTYNIILDDSHYKDLLYQQVEPPPAAVALEASLIKMGFPHQMNTEGTDEPLTICMCHVDSTEEGKLTTGGYYCPQCLSKYCELPVECRACGLTLVSAPHLARSYHHLFPPANFEEMQFDKQVTTCYACQKTFNDGDKQVYQCPTCKRMFCIDCDIFIHDTLHTCPGCATNLSTFQLIQS